jgi:hypothetical protein
MSLLMVVVVVMEMGMEEGSLPVRLDSVECGVAIPCQ